MELDREQRSAGEVVLSFIERTFFMLPLNRSQSRPIPESACRRAIDGLGPYQSLALLLIPLSIVEPLKLAAVAVAGHGHWLTGTGMIVFAYAVSIFLVERLFEMVKPKLMKLDWFARLWIGFVALRRRVGGWFRATFRSWTKAPGSQAD
jgi:hypothetical protein